VTASPAKGLGATLDLAERLAAQGYVVVPHLAARMVRDRSELAEICDRLVSAGIRSVFVPAGDKNPPEGSYEGALPLLEDLTTLGRPFPEVGITGYPESHPLISDDVTIQAMWDKRRHATSIVSNLVFDPAAIDSWLVRLRTRGITLPVWLGVPGPVERTKLLAMATKIGVGDSTRFLVKHKGAMLRLAAPGGFTGERFLEQCAPALARPGAAVAGLHVYTFNQVAATEQWRRSFLDRIDGIDSRR
jgi:methylenetetrahydrofolate reductase (NADPH)